MIAESGFMTELLQFVALRSPEAAALRGLYEVQPIRKLSDPDFDLGLFLMGGAGRRIKDLMNGAVYTTRVPFPEPVPLIREIYRRGWAMRKDIPDALNDATIKELSVYCGQLGIMAGKMRKHELIEALMQIDDIGRIALNHERVKVAAPGYRVLRFIYDERVDLEIDVYQLIKRGKLKSAVKSINRYQDRRRRFACGVWEEWLKTEPHSNDYECWKLAAKLIGGKYGTLMSVNYAQRGIGDAAAIMTKPVLAMLLPAGGETA